MIKNNVIQFGEGNILVGAKLRHLTFSETNKIYKLGTILPSNKLYNNENAIKIEARFSEFDKLISELEHLLRDDTYKDRKIEFKGYILDFSNYHKESIRTVIKFTYSALGYLDYVWGA